MHRDGDGMRMADVCMGHAVNSDAEHCAETL